MGIVDDSFKMNKVFYITDLHIEEKNMLESAVSAIVNESENIVLIGGDVTSKFAIFKLFVEKLRETIDKCEKNLMIVFVLGNHELWEFSGCSFEKIVCLYNRLLMKNNMFLLQNSMLIKKQNEIEIIDSKLLDSLNKDVEINKIVKKKIENSEIVIFGGLGFSGYNSYLNADSLMYSDVIKREQEILESKKFEKIYNNILEKFCEKKIIILSHMPMSCWRKEEEYNSNYYYVSGHTHINRMYYSNKNKIFADNQIVDRNMHMKYFYYSNRENMDIILDNNLSYMDGIHLISPEEYIDFYRCRNIMMNCYLSNGEIYLLKKNDYYSFIFKSLNGKLFILYGGKKIELKYSNLEYYYNNMYCVINEVKESFATYYEFLKRVESDLIKIGAYGNIHSGIIDIDFLNHVYINPVDFNIIPYYAENIQNRELFSSIEELLERKCPEIYENYKKVLDNDASFMNYRMECEDLKEMYKYLNFEKKDFSSVIGKIDRLFKYNILCIWRNEKNKKRLSLTERRSGSFYVEIIGKDFSCDKYEIRNLEETEYIKSIELKKLKNKSSLILNEKIELNDLPYGENGFKVLKDYFENNKYDNFTLAIINSNNGKVMKINCKFDDMIKVIKLITMEVKDFPKKVGIDLFNKVYIVELKFISGCKFNDSSEYAWEDYVFVEI